MALERQQKRVKNIASTMKDVIDGRIDDTICQKMDLDPYAFNDSQLSFYKDSKDKMWCFTSDSYKTLLSTKVNPESGETLPREYLQQIKTQLEIMDKLDISPFNPKTTTDAIKSLSTPDVISNKESDFYLNSIVRTAAILGFSSEKLHSLNADQINKFLIHFNATQSYLKDLTPKHQLFTFCRITYQILKANPKLSREFFEKLDLLC